MPRWTAITSMMEARAVHTATWLPSENIIFLVTGGTASDSISSALSSCEMHDPVSNTCHTVANMSALRFQHIATVKPLYC